MSTNRRAAKLSKDSHNKRKKETFLLQSSSVIGPWGVRTEKEPTAQCAKRRRPNLPKFTLLWYVCLPVKEVEIPSDSEKQLSIGQEWGKVKPVGNRSARNKR